MVGSIFITSIIILVVCVLTARIWQASDPRFIYRSSNERAVLVLGLTIFLNLFAAVVSGIGWAWS